MITRRWPVVLLAVVLASLVALVPVTRDGTTGGGSGDAGRDLRDTPVFVAAGAGVSLDVARVLTAIGDRPIVVAALPAGRGDGQTVCEAIAADLSTDVVVTYVGTGFPAICAGDGFPPPDDPTLRAGLLGTPTDLWLLRLGQVTQLSSELRVQRDQRERTVEVEELVLAFDVAVSDDYDDGVPRRQVAGGATEDPRTLGDALPLLAVLLVAFVLGGLVLQGLLLLLTARVLGRRQLRERRAALEVELARLARSALRPRDAASRAPVAELYLDAVAAVEGATTSADLDRAEALLGKAVRAVDQPV